MTQIEHQDACIPSNQSIVEAFLADIDRTSAEKRDLTDDQLRRLNFLLPDVLPRALEVMEEGKVQCYVGERSQRKVFVVGASSTSEKYIVFPMHYCPCSAFLYDGLQRNMKTHCKHQIACRLGHALGKCTIITVDDVTLAKMLIDE